MRCLMYAFCLLLILTAGIWAEVPPFIPVYWIVGEISNGSDEAGGTYSADGRTVVFYKDQNTYDSYNVQTLVSGNKFMLNAYYLWPEELTVGHTYEVIVVQGDDGYGAGPYQVNISGRGWDEVLGSGRVTLQDFSQFNDPTLVWNTLVEKGIIDQDGNILFSGTEDEFLERMAGTSFSESQLRAIYDILQAAREDLFVSKGGGVEQSPASGEVSLAEEPAPRLKIWFDNRLYQPTLTVRGKRQVIASRPVIRVEISIDPPFSLASNIESYSIVVDPGTSSSRTLTLSSQHMTQKSYAAAAGEGNLRVFDLQYTIADELAEGQHTFRVEAASSGTYGAANAVAETASVEVMGGPLRLIGTPLAYPSPFSISKHGTVSIQYELSQNANIDVYIVDANGSRLKKFACDAGTEGGTAGINKLTWDGRAAQGYLAGNAIYVCTIVSRSEGRLLGKLKLAVVD